MDNFKEVFKERQKQDPRGLVYLGNQEAIIKESIKVLDDLHNVPPSESGSINLIIAMEELAELIQRVSKYLRGEKSTDSMIDMIEEMADVEIVSAYLYHITKIYYAEVNLAKDIKLEELKRKIDSGKYDKE